MKGYLQRLAASAVQAVGPVHPVLQPIFSAGLEASSRDRPDLDESGRSDADTPLQSRERAAEPQRQSSPSHASEPPAANAPTPVRELRAPPLIRAHAIAAAPTPSDVRPGLPPRRHRDDPDDAKQRAKGPDRAPTDSIRPSSPPPTRADRAPPPSDSGAPQTAADKDGDGDTGSHRRQASSERAFIPLLASVTRADEPAPAHIARPPAAPARAPRLIQNERSAASEPNEVQIHIGRIEVTAIQPAPARPAAGPPRRSGMSLDDYLKQRNGRAS